MSIGAGGAGGQGVSPWAGHRAMVWTLIMLWLGLAALELGKGLYFNGSETPILLFTLYGIYLYLPWLLLSLVLAYVALASAHMPVMSRQFLALHVPIACLFGLLHIALLSSAYWLFWPDRVTRVSVGFVYGEQALKWFHFELLAYFLILGAWRRRLGQPSERSALARTSEALTLATEQGVIRLDPEAIDCLFADDNYVIIHAGNRQHRVRCTLKQLQQKLDGSQFQQAHRSAIVNLARVHELGTSRLILHNGSKVPVSRRRYRQLLLALQK